MVRIVSRWHSLGMPNTKPNWLSCPLAGILLFTAMYIDLSRNVFFLSFGFLSAKCCHSVSIHTLIDVASIMFAGKKKKSAVMFLFCFVFRFCFFVSRTYSDSVVFTKGSGPIMMKQQKQMVSRTARVIRTFIYLWQPFFFPFFFKLSDTSLIFPITISWFPVFSNQEGLCECVVLGRGYPWTIWPCCDVMLPTWGGGGKKKEKKKKVLFVDRSGVVNSVLKLLLQVCVEGREGFKKCFVLSFYCSTMFLFSLFKVMVAVSHFSLWSSLLKKVLLVATQSCWVCVRVMFCVWTFTGLLHKTYHNMGTVWSAEFAE